MSKKRSNDEGSVYKRKEDGFGWRRTSTIQTISSSEGRVDKVKEK